MTEEGRQCRCHHLVGPKEGVCVGLCDCASMRHDVVGRDGGVDCGDGDDDAMTTIDRGDGHDCGGGDGRVLSKVHVVS